MSLLEKVSILAMFNLLFRSNFYRSKHFFISLWRSFARVELAKHTFGSYVAVKVVDLKAMKDSYIGKILSREGTLLSRLNHPSIVRLIEITSTKHLYCLVLQYMPGAKSVSALLSERGPLTEIIASNICHQLISALIYIHSANILHRDVKTVQLSQQMSPDWLWSQQSLASWPTNENTLSVILPVYLFAKWHYFSDQLILYKFLFQLQFYDLVILLKVPNFYFKWHYRVCSPRNVKTRPNLWPR